MRHRLTTFLSHSATVLLLASPLWAQTALVLPTRMDGVEGRAALPLPFSLSTGIRLQALYQGPHFGGERRFSQISFRPDWNEGKSFPGKQYIHMNVTLTNVPLRADEMGADFDENYELKVKSQVLDGRISLPAQPELAKGPRPFNVTIKFDSPMVFVQDWRKGNVLLEILVVRQPQGSYPLDSSLACTSERIQFGKQDAACQVQHPGGPKPLVVEAGASSKLGGPMTFTMSNALPNALGMMVVGLFRDGEPFLGRTLPFDVHSLLDPGRLGPDPAPGCYVNTDWLFLYPVVADSLGRSVARVPIPNDERWLSLFLSCQGLSLDIRANPLGFVWSRGARTNVCGPLPVTTVMRTFKDPKQIPKTGQVLRGEAPVIELR